MKDATIVGKNIRFSPGRGDDARARVYTHEVSCAREGFHVCRRAIAIFVCARVKDLSLRAMFMPARVSKKAIGIGHGLKMYLQAFQISV